MKRNIKNIAYLFLIGSLLFACTDEGVRNIAGEPTAIDTNPVGPTEVVPIDVGENALGFSLLEKMQGHWVGRNRVIADDFDWFAFDYRANSPSQVHGIFEGGSLGNLLTSFFITDFKDKRTIMARNGGVLNGIYRSSYFVLDSVMSDPRGDYFRLVDAKGGTGVMFMELRFKNDSLYWNAYTSRLGVILPPTRHMTFKAKRMHTDLAEAAAAAVGFPQNIPAWDFSQGFDTDFLYVNPGDAEARSATFLAQAETNADVVALAQSAGDPWRIDQHPHLGSLTISIARNASQAEHKLFISLSKEALTDQEGYFVADENVYDSILLFPELSIGENQFTAHYLHPGSYFINLTIDANGDGLISQGDLTHPLRSVQIQPLENARISISDINVQN